MRRSRPVNPTGTLTLMRALALMLGLLACAGNAEARQVVSPQDRVGDTYELDLLRSMRSAADDGSSSSSNSGGMLVERVLAIRDEGLELEFDLPPNATAEERARDWAWPVRVLKSPDGTLDLLNAPELERRIDAWLVLADLPREACGHWIFTWTAFKIECDPQSVMSTLAAYDLRVRDLREGALYPVPGGLPPAPLRLESATPEASVFISETPVDADQLRLERAESDVVAGDIMGEPKTLEAALEDRAGEQITGTITLTLSVDANGRVTSRTTATQLVITDAEGVVERTTSTQTVERRLL